MLTLLDGHEYIDQKWPYPDRLCLSHKGESGERLRVGTNPTQEKNVCLKSGSGWHRWALSIPSSELCGEDSGYLARIWGRGIYIADLIIEPL